MDQRPETSAPVTHCPKCWYDLTGLPSNRCPECGNEISDEQIRDLGGDYDDAVSPIDWRRVIRRLLIVPSGAWGITVLLLLQIHTSCVFSCFLWQSSVFRWVCGHKKSRKVTKRKRAAADSPSNSFVLFVSFVVKHAYRERHEGCSW